MIVALAVLLAGAITFVVLGSGFVVALAGVVATVTVVVGMCVDFLRR